MSTKILDNGTVLTIGLVGAVAAIGAATKAGVYGSMARRGKASFQREREKERHAEELRSALNAHFGNARLFVPGQGYMSLRDEYQQGPTELVIEIKGEDACIHVNMHDEEGDQAGSVQLARFPRHDIEGIAAFLNRHRPSLFKSGSRARGSMSRDDFRTSHLRGDAKKLAEAIKKLVREMNGSEPDGGGCPAFITTAQRRRMGWSPVKGTVMVLVFDGGDLAPYMNPDYGDKAKYNAMQDLIRRMGYWTEYESGVEASVYKR